MNKKMYWKLASDNIRRNKSTYIPYILTCIFCIAMTYMMFFISQSPDLDTAVPSALIVQTTMLFGVAVICIFSVIFLLYSNGFLMKRRQKELGLYNILGMEKRHIGKMLRREMLISFVISMFGGILVGVLGSKLALLLLFKLLNVPPQFGFYFCNEGAVACAGIYGVIFLLTLLKNMRRIHLTQPAELLRGGNAGEREPKAKWLMALIGFVCLGSGYYIAITTESPLEAINMFFIAVLLVMAGTYLVFTAGSIAVLKLMRRNKRFYYKIKNFTAVSGMLYRMKQNAVGLASICILSTGVLLMLSTTVCLNFGMEDIMRSRYPYEVYFNVGGISFEEGKKIREVFENSLAENEVPVDGKMNQMNLTFACFYDNGKISVTKPGSASPNELEYLTLIMNEEYERVHGVETGLKDGEVLMYRKGEKPLETLEINGLTYNVKENLKEFPLYTDGNYLLKSTFLVVTEKDFAEIDKVQKEIYERAWSSMVLEMGFDVDGFKEDESFYGNKVRERLTTYISTGREAGRMSEDAYIMSGIRSEEYAAYYATNGGLLFLGIFLGTLFLMGAAMIIYYKQLSEGYEDKERFEIMQKVGMSRKEVKSSIRRQILMVFFLPLIMAILHICAAFPMIRRLLLLFGMTNTSLFMICTGVTALVFAVLYGIIYMLTAKKYYHIVERAV